MSNPFGKIEDATAPLLDLDHSDPIPEADHDEPATPRSARARSLAARPPKPKQPYAGTPGRGPDALGRVSGVVKTPNVHPPRRGGEPPRPGAGGRTRFTEQQLSVALRQSGGINSEACRILQRNYGYTVSVNTMGRLIASSPNLQAAKEQAGDLVLDYAEMALIKKIEAGDDKSIHFLLRFKGAARGYSQSHKHSGDKKGAPIKTETTFNFDSVPIDKLRDLYDTLTKAREAAVDAARFAAVHEE